MEIKLHSKRIFTVAIVLSTVVHGVALYEYAHRYFHGVDYEIPYIVLESKDTSEIKETYKFKKPSYDAKEMQKYDKSESDKLKEYDVNMTDVDKDGTVLISSKKSPFSALERSEIIKYLVNLRKFIEINKYCTEQNKDIGLIGNLTIAFSIDAWGNFHDIRITVPSGDELLDTTAYNAMLISSGKVKRPASTGRFMINTKVVIKYQYGL